VPAQPLPDPFVNPDSQSDQPRSPLVAAVMASVEESAGRLHKELTRREFRELVEARGRSCDEALLEIRRAALLRDPSLAGASEATWRRRITGHRAQTEAERRVTELEAENARLRLLIADQESEIDELRRFARRELG
jgi:hypothetical protein